MRERKQWSQKLDNGGFSLMEVLVAFMVLLIASQILILGNSFMEKMGDRIDTIEAARRNIGAHLYDKSSCISGTVRMNVEDGMEVLSESGWLYTGEESEIRIPMNIIWVEEPVWEDIIGE